MNMSMIISDVLTRDQQMKILDDIHYRIEHYEYELLFYPYRTANLKNCFFWTDDSPFTNLSQSTFIQRIGNEHDNHVVYSVTDNRGNTIYISFSDHHIGVGTEIYDDDDVSICRCPYCGTKNVHRLYGATYGTEARCVKCKETYLHCKLGNAYAAK